MTDPIRVMKGPHDSFITHDVLALKPNHFRVRGLRANGATPDDFGCRIWRSSYLLVDYLSRHSFSVSDHALEIGCGWGLPSQFLQKTFGMRVTATDADPQVEGYVELMSEMNETDVKFRHRSFEQLQAKELETVDMLVGADICYRQSNGRDLSALLERFLSRPGRQVILADSGRNSFFELVRQLESRWQLTLHDLCLQLPTRVAGHVVHIGAH